MLNNDARTPHENTGARPANSDGGKIECTFMNLHVYVLHGLIVLCHLLAPSRMDVLLVINARPRMVVCLTCGVHAL